MRSGVTKQPRMLQGTAVPPGGVRYHRADRVWATAVRIALSSGHVPRVALSLAASGGRTSEPVTKEAP
jgi:hypothetical protein